MTDGAAQPIAALLFLHNDAALGAVHGLSRPHQSLLCRAEEGERRRKTERERWRKREGGRGTDMYSENEEQKERCVEENISQSGVNACQYMNSKIATFIASTEQKMNARQPPYNQPLIIVSPGSQCSLGTSDCSYLEQISGPPGCRVVDSAGRQVILILPTVHPLVDRLTERTKETDS